MLLGPVLVKNSSGFVEEKIQNRFMSFFTSTALACPLDVVTGQSFVDTRPDSGDQGLGFWVNRIADQCGYWWVINHNSLSPAYRSVAWADRRIARPPNRWYMQAGGSWFAVLGAFDYLSCNMIT